MPARVLRTECLEDRRVSWLEDGSRVEVMRAAPSDATWRADHYYPYGTIVHPIREDGPDGRSVAVEEWIAPGLLAAARAYGSTYRPKGIYTISPA
jgi:hypothetical protein